MITRHQKKYFISVTVLIVFAVIGYFILGKNSSSPSVSFNSDDSILHGKNMSDRPDNKRIINSSIPKDSSASITKKSEENASANNLANWKTYNNDRLHISFLYPHSCLKQGDESNTINLKGETMSISVNLIDTATQTVFSLLYSVPPYGPEVYKIEENQYRFYKSSHELEMKKNVIAGNISIESSTTMNRDIKGNIYDPPLKLIHVVFLDKKKSGAFNLNFRTPEPNSGNEIKKFKYLLSTIRFSEQ